MPFPDFPSIPDALARNDPAELLYLPISLSMDPPEETDPGLAEAVCLQLSAHADPTVRGNAILGFGHLARTVGAFRDAAAVRAAVSAGLVDPNSYVRGQADAATDDLQHFVKWRIERPG
jgi:hypothetical protein